MIRKFFALLCLSVVFLAGCESLTPVGTETVASRKEQSQALLAQKDKEFFAPKRLQVDPGYYLGSAKRVLTKEEALPKQFEQDIVFSCTQSMDVHDIAVRLVNMVGIPVKVAAGVTSKSKVLPFHQGSLRRFLDVVASHYSLFWEYRDESIVLFKVKTKTFTINILPGNVAYNDTITNESNASADSSGSSDGTGDTSMQTNQRTVIEYKGEAWNEIQLNLENMLSSAGKATVNVSAGTVTVTDSPIVLSRVEEYVDYLNLKFAQQVAIEVQIFNLETSAESEMGFNLDAAFENSDFSASLASATPVSFSSGIGTLSGLILDSSSNSTLSKFSGTELLFQALRTYGNISLVTTGSGITSNDQPLPIQNVNRIAYLKSISQTVTTDVGTSTELEAGTVTTGFSMLVIPHFLDDNRVALQYSITLSSLDELREITSGEQTIQAPEISTRSFMQRVNIRMGSTLILAGFEQSGASVDGGTGILGVGRHGEETHNTIIVAITVHDATGR